MSDAALELREVRGPSAVGGGWRRALELLYLIAVTDFKRTYFGTVLGYVWSLARPLMLFGVLLALLVVITIAVSALVASLYPRFRDMAIIWSVASTVLFYGTPVL